MEEYLIFKLCEQLRIFEFKVIYIIENNEFNVIEYHMVLSLTTSSKINCFYLNN
jgi:hypothetical protein